MKACLQWLLLPCLLVFLAPSLHHPVQGLATDRPSQNNKSKPPARRAGGAAPGASHHKDWFSVRKSGVKIKSSSPKPPRWEKEGDALYHPNSNVGQVVKNSNTNSDQKGMTFSEAKELLSQLTLSTPTSSDDTRSHSTKNNPVTTEKAAIDEQQPSSSPFLWGTLSVGPVWKSRLVQAGCLQPTPVQTAAYSVILKKQNAVIASPTGSGKSLAFLVPLLTSRQLHSRVLLVTPTVELALQLQNQVEQLVPDKDNTDTSTSLFHVLGTSPKPDKDDLQLLPFVGDSPLIAGTPRFLRRLLQEVKLAESGAFGPKMEALSESIRSNLCGIVLDEADRLLKTELAATNMLEKQQAKESNMNNKNSDTKKKRKFTPWAPTQTEQLLGELPVSSSLDKIQIICASATVGRTLRRQLMQLTGAASMDKAATLVTASGDVRTKKDAQKRKSSLIPSTLKHCYRLVAEQSDDTTSTSTMTHASTLDSLWTTLQSIPPAPTLVFPGRVGVDLVVKALTDRGLDDIRTLSAESLKAPPGIGDNNWNQTSVYVVNDKFGRGLDLSGVEYVVLLSPPSSAAGYTHLAGRTGRNGQFGTAITLVRPKEAPKLVAIAQALGLDFASTEDISSSSRQEEKKTQPATEKQLMNQSSNEKDIPMPSTTEAYPSWADLTDSALQRKTIGQLLEYLVSHGVSLEQEDGGPKLKKADILTAVYKLHIDNKRC